VVEIQTMLTRAGFQVVPEGTLSSGWTVIEASKPKASGGPHSS
jgi:hypothetical protein